MSELAPARWKGGPPICPAANLPAFPTERDAAKFREDNCPSCKVRQSFDAAGKPVGIKQWLCKECGHWHYNGIAPDPAGASSGNGRGDSGAPLGFKPFMRRQSVRSSTSTNQDELKKQADPYANWKGPFCAKCDSPVKGGKCVNKECVTNAKEEKPAPPKAPGSVPAKKAPPTDKNQLGFF
jgi:hypothetical protein